MNYQHVFTAIAIISGTMVFFWGSYVAVVLEGDIDKVSRNWLIGLAILTIITAALAAGMEK